MEGTRGGVDFRGGVDTALGDETIGGPEATWDVPETTGDTETLGGVAALARGDVECTAGGDDIDGVGVVFAGSLTKGAISWRWVISWQ